jgi:RNA polymerase sigma-70 factor (ECF subfamily)
VDEAEYREYLLCRVLHLLQDEFQESTWRAFWENVVEDQPAAEVAERLGVSVAAVYAAKSRVLRRLRQELHLLLD